MSTPEISIIIVNYNSGRFLSGTLKSILDNPPSNEWECVVFDNKSGDDSLVNAINEFQQDSRFKFIKSETNLGFTGGNNKAISSAAGKFILLLNPDTSVTNGALDKLCDYLKSNEDAGAVGCRLVNAASQPTVSFGWFPAAGGILAGAFIPRRFQSVKSGGLGVVPDDSIKTPLEVDYVCGGCLMTRRETWDKVGPLDEGFFAYFEETDWCLRLKKIGYKIVYIPDAVVFHFEGQSFGGVPYKKMEIFVVSARRFFLKHYSMGLWQLYRGSNIVGSALRIGVLSVTGIFMKNRRVKIKPTIEHHRAFLRALLKTGK